MLAGVQTEHVPSEQTTRSPTRRRCAVTRQEAEKEDLIRFVVGPDNVLVPDVNERLPGRGVWITASRDIVAAAKGPNLARVLRSPVTVPDQLAKRVETLLASRCMETLGLARRAREAIGGYESTREWLRTGRGRVILAAIDGSVGGREKIRNAAPEIPVLAVLTRAEMGAVFGRDACTHAVVGAEKLADRMVRDGRRLAGFRGSAEEVESERSDDRA